MIVGAGAAGISAASKLMENGYEEIVILEAEDRIGGRINTIPYANGFIDLGAQWCHGEKNNAIYELVHDHFEFGSLNSESQPFDYITSEGQKASQEQCTNLDILLEKLLEQSVSEGRNESIGAIIEREYEKSVNLLPEDEKTVARQMLASFRNQMNGYFASESWFDVSAFYSKIYSQECEGDELLTWKTQGFKTVFDFITVSRTEQNETDLLNC